MVAPTLYRRGQWTAVRPQINFKSIRKRWKTQSMVWMSSAHDHLKPNNSLLPHCVHPAFIYFRRYTILTLVDPLSLTALVPRKTSHPIWMKSWRILSEVFLPMLRTPTMLFTYLTHSDLTPKSWTTLSVHSFCKRPWIAGFDLLPEDAWRQRAFNEYSYKTRRASAHVEFFFV